MSFKPLVLNRKGFTNVAKAIASSANVSVRFRGSGAYTDGKIINLPHVKNEIDPAMQDVLLGYLVHEAGHVRATDFNIKNTFLTNVFEDHFIERVMRSALPRGEDMLVKTWLHVQEDVLKKFADDPGSNPFAAVANYMIYQGQVVTMRRTVKPEIIDLLSEAVIQHWGDIRKDLDAFLGRSRYISSTQESHALSEEVREYLKKLKPEDESQDQDQGESQDQDQGESQDQDQGESQGQDQGESQDQDQGESQGQDQGESQGQDQGESQGQDQGESQDQDQGNGKGKSGDQNNDDRKGGGNDSSDEKGDGGEGDATEPSKNQSEGKTGKLSEEALDKLKEAIEKSKKYLEENPNAEADDLTEIISEKINEIAKQLEEAGLIEYDTDTSYSVSGLATKQDLIENSTVLQKAAVVSQDTGRVLRQMFEARTRTKRTTTRRGSKIDPKSLTKVALKSSKVFEKKVYEKGLSTAITIAVDMSGSMKADNRDIQAISATLGITTAINATKGLSARATVFPGVLSDCEQLSPRGVRPDNTLSGLRASGGTPIYAALDDAVWELHLAKAERKVVIVITDGVFSDCDDLDDIVHQNGMEVFWIGVATDKLGFKKSINVKSAEEIPNAMRGYIETLL